MPKLLSEAEREKRRIERNEAKKKRYREDPEYRKRCFDAVQRHRKKKRREAGLPNEKLPPDYTYRIGDIANACNRSVNTVRDYHARGVLPAPLVNQRGWRYYTYKQVLTVGRLFALLDSKEIDMPTLTKLAKQEW